ncbi:hypothetical protein J1782_00945 [Rahnella sp. BCC 1045]|uniref:hypothetical protein n=1 Tax=Rahnella sp. BCC 1045 TaxID=2816251 RepID=UPI001C2596D2|nr:hypothetical protein [Rahnella sp. BCC 1045]MBU9818458.1 hypothetical protein [Rahnella sp. BCC 1045]
MDTLKEHGDKICYAIGIATLPYLLAGKQFDGEMIAKELENVISLTTNHRHQEIYSSAVKFIRGTSL